MKSPQSFRRIVTRSADLKQLTDRAAELGALDEKLRNCLPPELAPRVHVANVRDDCLVLQADGAAWATRVRYKTPEILAQLRALPEFAHVRSVRVRKRPAGVHRRPPPAAPRAMSSTVAAALTGSAEAIDDTELAQALARLARHARARGTD